jgi:hypothetical protein
MGNYLLLHQLSVIINMPPWTDTSTKRKYPTTIFIYFGPFRRRILLILMKYAIF